MGCTNEEVLRKLRKASRSKAGGNVFLRWFCDRLRRDEFACSDCEYNDNRVPRSDTVSKSDEPFVVNGWCEVVEMMVDNPCYYRRVCPYSDQCGYGGEEKA